MNIFNIKADIDLNIMKENQSLSSLTGHACIKLAETLNQKKYNLILAQGDTTTTFAAALTAFYLKIPFGHVEAGLRSYNMQHPYPE